VLPTEIPTKVPKKLIVIGVVVLPKKLRTSLMVIVLPVGGNLVPVGGCAIVNPVFNKIAYLFNLCQVI
jgi:hypothetical protein